jgi:hypothetical protein
LSVKFTKLSDVPAANRPRRIKSICQNQAIF